MTIDGYRQEIILRLSGGVLDLELSEENIDGCINAAFRQVLRYIDETQLETIPYSPCIDLKGKNVIAVTNVFRTQGYLSGLLNQEKSTRVDPMYLGAWQMLSGGCNIGKWTENYGAFNSLLQIRNTMSTDMSYVFDKQREQLYVNCSFGRPDSITIQYIKRYNSVDEIQTDYWMDIQLRLSLAICKQVIGRIRKKYTQTNALWQLDTDILQEGIDEEKELHEQLEKASQLSYPLD